MAALEPRNILVVIGTGGMGQAIAQRLANGRLVILADYSDVNLDKAAHFLRSNGHDVKGHKVNIVDFNSVLKLAQDVAAAGRIDAIIHTAGVSPIQASPRQIFEVDLLGTANILEAFAATVGAGASCVCIASMAATSMPLSPQLERHLATASLEDLLSHKEIDFESPMAYQIAKRGNQLRVQAAAKVWGTKGARVNSVSPGVILTPMAAQELDGPHGPHMRGAIANSALRRYGTPDDIASVVAFLASSDSSYITGTDILIDGGVTSASRWTTTV